MSQFASFQTRTRQEIDDETDPQAFLPGYCFECGKPGHWCAKCPEGVCTECGMDGHTFFGCEEAWDRIKDEFDDCPEPGRSSYLEGMLKKFEAAAKPFPCNDIVYRALRPHEQPEHGIHPPGKPPGPKRKKMSVASAIATGSSTASHYIHTSRSRQVALEKYAGRAELEKGDRVAVIDLLRLPQTTRVVSGIEAAEKEFGTGSQAFRFANSDDEVVLDGPVPPSAIIDVVEFEGSRLSTPTRKRLTHDCDWREERMSAMKRRNKLGCKSECFSFLPPLRRFAAPALVKKPASGVQEFKVAGVSFNRETVSTLTVGQDVILQKDDGNRHDPTAVKVLTHPGLKQIGFVPKEMTVHARALLAVNGKRKGAVSDVHRWRDGPTGITVSIPS